VATSEEELQRLLATQNQPDVPADAQYYNQPQQAPAPSAPSQAPQNQGSNVAQAVANMQPAPQAPQQSNLQAFFSNFNPQVPGHGIIPTLADLEKNQANANQAAYEQNKKNTLDQAAALDELHAEKASAPVLKSFLKNMPGISPEVSQAIDGMDVSTLRSFLPRLSESFKLQNDITDAVLKPKKEAETVRHNKAEEDIQRLHYENLLKEQQNKGQEKADQQTTKRVDDTLDTLATVKRGASAGTFGMAAKRSVLASDGLRILDQIKSGTIKADPSVQQELATVMASALSGGAQPGEHAIRAFVNRTGQGDAAKAAVYLSSAPQSAISKAFLKQWEAQLQGQDKYYKDLRDQTVQSQWEKLKPALDKNPSEKARFIRSVKAQYPNFDISKLGEKNSDYGFGPLSGANVPKSVEDLDKMSDQELKEYLKPSPQRKK